MSEKIEFEKVYTRDTCVILQQAWIGVFTKNLEEKLGVKSPYKFKILYYLNDGVLEIWENKKATEWLMDKLLKKNEDDPSLSLSIMDNYSGWLKNLEKYWQKGKSEDAEALEFFVGKLFEAMLGYIVMYFSSTDENTPGVVKKLADGMRTADKFFDENDKFIRNSLKSIYPHLASCVTAITKSEISNPPSLENLRMRSLGAILTPDDIQTISLENYARANPALSFKDLGFAEAVDSFGGRSAFKGLVVGIVRIVKRKDQVTFVREGEVIVSPMTTPDYISAMKVASAFVTDEGGVMCHAAIIAREMKKPCIIGTKIATRVLKDGDLIEVDADKGVVRILKRA